MPDSIITIEWPLEAKPVSINEVAGGHWMKRHRLLTPWKSQALDAAIEYGLEGSPPATVTVSLPFSVKRRRDPHNYTGTVVKAIIDGFVAAGVWPDDTSQWVRVRDPELRIDKSDEPLVKVRLRFEVGDA